MIYQRRSSTEHEPAASTIILGWALAAIFGAALVLIVALPGSVLLRWMCGCWK